MTEWKVGDKLRAPPNWGFQWANKVCILIEFDESIREGTIRLLSTQETCPMSLRELNEIGHYYDDHITRLRACLVTFHKQYMRWEAYDNTTGLLRVEWIKK